MDAPDGERTGGIRANLRVAYREHRPYLVVSTGTFVLGFLAGLGVFLAGVDLLAMMNVESLRDILPEDINAATIYLNNTRVFVLLLVGVATVGLLTVVGLAFNGLLIGWVVGTVSAQRGVAFVAVGLIPHGILELPAFFLAGAVALRIVHRVIRRVFGSRDRVMTGDEWRRTGQFLLAGWVALLAAAVVEFYVTGPLLEALFG